MPSPREQMIATAAALFQRDGYRATSWRKLVQESGAPWGSAHHYFPGGKEQLAVAAVELAAQGVARGVAAAFADATSPADGVRRLFHGSARRLAASGFTAGCPVTTVALETVPESAAMTAACDAAFTGWRTVIDEAFRRLGVDPARSADLAMATLAMFEGALVLARAARSTEPLETGGAAMAALLESEGRA